MVSQGVNFPPRGFVGYLLTLIAIGMSLTEVYLAVTGGMDAIFERPMFYMAAAAIIFLAPPKQKDGVVTSDRRKMMTVFLGVAAVVSVAWLLWEFDRLLERTRYIDDVLYLDIFFGVVCIVLVLEATRRAINLTLPLIALFFLVYTYFGPLMPWEFRHGGIGFLDIIDHFYMTDGGLWSAPMYVFVNYMFLFILFGAVLDASGAGKIYIDFAFLLTGRMRGGPAKAAVVASALSGTISGSATANIVTTGTFTIPLMKKMGYRPHIAGAVETAASTGGQIMPPIMGTAAFLLAEFTGTSYFTIIKISVIPALLYFMSVFVFVHLEAAKNDIRGMSWEDLPDILNTIGRALVFLIPPAVLIYFMVAGRSVQYAGVSGIIATIISMAVLGIIDYLREGFGKNDFSASLALDYLRSGSGKLVRALVRGAQQCAPIAAACATAGIIIGATTITGLGLKFSSIVVSASGGSLFLGIILVGVASFVLGMGLPSSSAYIVLATMAAPALIELGGMSAVTAHMIIFWFSLDSCYTPPVCIPAYTAAAIAEADPMKTGWTSFRAAKGLYVIPFLFAYSPAILLNGSVAEIILVTLTTGIALIAGMAGLSGFLVGRATWAERGGLLLGGLMMLWPKLAVQGSGFVLLTILVIFQITRHGAWCFRTQGAEESLPKSG